jgi:hypothetical protein
MKELGIILIKLFALDEFFKWFFIPIFLFHAFYKSWVVVSIEFMKFWVCFLLFCFRQSSTHLSLIINL